jgi:DNA polymerase-1
MIYLVTRQVFLFDSSLFNIVSLKEGIELLQVHEELGLDTETEGLDLYTKKLLLLQLGNTEFQVLFDINSYGGSIPTQLKDFLNTSGKLFILQNAKFDLKFLFHQGVIIRKVYDTMLAEYILTNGLQYSGRDLATLAMKYGEIYLDKSVRGEIIRNGLSDAVLNYGAQDVACLPIIKEKQMLKAIELKLTAAIQLDNSFVVPLAYTEYCGIKLNLPRWLEKTRKSTAEALELKLKLEDQLWQEGKYSYFSGMQDMFTGKQECTINWDSPKQVIKLFKEYGINVIIKDKGESKETIDAKVLEPQKSKFTILPPYLEYKGKQKEVSTYGENWKKYINPVTGRIHTTYQQLIDTSRLSSGNKRDGTPNLQNIPSDDETRACFIPEPGNVMIDADYSSQEQIVLANFSKEEKLLNFYKKGFKDMHSYVAFLMYPEIRRVALEDLVPESLHYIPMEHKDKRKLAKNAGSRLYKIINIFH